VAGQLEHAQGVLRLLIAPCVAGDHGDAEHLHIRGLEQRQNGHLVRAAGPGAVLIDEHKALLRRRRGRAGRKQQRYESVFHRWVL